MAVIKSKDGKTLYRVDVERHQTGTIYVLANSKEEAQDDANELADKDCLSETELEVYVAPASKAPTDDSYVWTGGPDGDDIVWKLLKK